jgi:hypothetical protein
MLDNEQVVSSNHTLYRCVYAAYGNEERRDGLVTRGMMEGVTRKKMAMLSYRE